MQRAHATSRRLVASIVILAIVGMGCATVTSPTPSAAPATVTAAPVTPTPTAAPATRPYLGPDYGQAWTVFSGREPSARLTVEVRNLRGMAGLDLAIGLEYAVSGGSENATLLRLPIVESPFAALMTPEPVPSGHFGLWIFAGPPPCFFGFGMHCGGWVEGQPIIWPDYVCRMEVDIGPGEDRSIAVDGLPRLLPGQAASLDFPGCLAAAGRVTDSSRVRP